MDNVRSFNYEAAKEVSAAMALATIAEQINDTVRIIAVYETKNGETHINYSDMNKGDMLWLATAMHQHTLKLIEG